MHHYGFKHFKEWRFFQLALLIIAILIISPFIGENWLFRVLIQLFMLNSLLVTLSAIGNKVWVRRTLWILWGMVAITSLAGFLPMSSPFRDLCAHVELGCLTLLLLACVACILAFVFRNLRATMDGIFAALTAYLLVAYAFAIIFTLVRLEAPESFNMPVHADANSLRSTRLEMTYFSFVTIATLGYGDIVPVTPFARMLVVIEAVVGQFYVAVVVALLVGSLIAQSQSSRDSDE